MPTPFMHLALVGRLYRDPDLPGNVRALLEASRGAFLLGSIAPDARVSSGISRVTTHFFEYRPVIDPPAVTAMLARYAALRRPALRQDSQAAFVAGYAGHLVMDEIWCTRLMFPHFFTSGPEHRERMRLFFVLLGHLDRRDRALIPEEFYAALDGVAPNGWLPFIGDADLCAWRDVVASQLSPGGASRTLDILSRQLGVTPEQLAATIEHDMPLVWARVAPEQLAEIEALLYNRVRDAVTGYLNDHVTWVF